LAGTSSALTSRIKRDPIATGDNVQNQGDAPDNPKHARDERMADPFSECASASPCSCATDRPHDRSVRHVSACRPSQP